MTAFAALAVVLALSCGGDTPVAPDGTPIGNRAPVADAGGDQTVSATLPVSLDASASGDADGDALVYLWAFASTPAGSGAAFDDASSATPSFTPDLPGAYVVRLTVSDAEADSPSDEATITAQDNTAALVVGAAGGQVTSADGNLVLDIPANALTTDEEISITLAPIGQRPAILDEVPVTYELRPDGLTFGQPITVTLTPPASFEPTAGVDTSEVRLGTLVTLAAGVVEVNGGQELRWDGETKTLTLSGTISHFSSVAIVDDILIGGVSANLKASAYFPQTAYVGDPFSVPLKLTTTPPTPWDNQVRVWVNDASGAGPVGPNQVFGGEWTEGLGDNFSRDGLFEYVCSDVGNGAGGIKLRLGTGAVADRILQSAILPLDWLTITLTSPTNCQAAPTFFTAFDLLGPEGFTRVDGEPWFSGGDDPKVAFSRQGGATVTNASGDPVLEAEATSLLAEVVYGAIGLTDDGVLVHGSSGVHTAEGPLPTTSSATPPTWTLTQVPTPATGPDLSANTTDGYVFEDESGCPSVVTAIHGDADVAVFRSGSCMGGPAGFVFDASLAEAFKPGGTSVFGSGRRPVSIYIPDNGFDDNGDQALGLAVDQNGFTSLWRLERAGNAVTATEVNSLFLADEGRRIRCLQTICSATSYGSAFGFGSTSVFHWDGGSTFTPIQALAGRAIGTDLRLTKDGTVLVGSTSFLTDGALVLEVSLAGDFINSAFDDVSAACDGPGHIGILDSATMMLSCNLNGRVETRPIPWN